MAVSAGAEGVWVHKVWVPSSQCLVLNSRKESNMREWHKPMIEETESGMEVTSYLPAELDRA
jgi:coenzyme PQQ precursor peptide PqqA